MVSVYRYRYTAHFSGALHTEGGSGMVYRSERYTDIGIPIAVYRGIPLGMGGIPPIPLGLPLGMVYRKERYTDIGIPPTLPYRGRYRYGIPNHRYTDTDIGIPISVYHTEDPVHHGSVS